MAGGNKKEVFNTRERVISTDWNRLQRFIAADRAELERYRVNSTFGIGMEYSAPFTATSLSLAISAPLRADVYEGLAVMPLAGLYDLLVTPGVVGMNDPDGIVGSSDPSAPNPDDSAYKLVVDAGVQSIGTLAIAPNLGPGIRIDTIECQRAESVLEMESRDIFNSSTGLFTPATVDKVAVGRLAYRVRQGTPGGGMPAPVVGWLPIAVASVPVGAVSTDDCTFWDVRPLVRDREVSPTRAAYGIGASPMRVDSIHVDSIDVIGQTRVSGTAESHAFGGRLGGGREYRGTPGVDEAYVDAQDVTNQEPGFAPGANQIWYLWHLFPHALPRWVRYLKSPSYSGQRVPYGPRGIPTVSTTAPFSLSQGIMTLAIAVPNSTGLGVSCTSGVCCGAFGSDGVGVPVGGLADGHWTLLDPSAMIGPISPTSAAGNLVQDDFTLVAGTHFPPQARAVRVTVGFAGIGTAGAPLTYEARVSVRRPGAPTEVALVHWESGNVQLSSPGPFGTLSFLRTFDIPHLPAYLITGSGMYDIHFSVRYNLSGAAIVKGAEQANVIGWRLAG